VTALKSVVICTTREVLQRKLHLVEMQKLQLVCPIL